MNLKKSNKTLGSSYFLGCSFWETKYENMFLTDYDINTNKSLKTKDMKMLFKGANYLHVSNEMIKTDEELNLVIEQFNEICNICLK